MQPLHTFDPHESAGLAVCARIRKYLRQSRIVQVLRVMYLGYRGVIDALSAPGDAKPVLVNSKYCGPFKAHATEEGLHSTVEFTCAGV